MAGIYIHIPFCKQACIYCNFHFSTSGKLQNNLIECILLEIEQRKSYLQQEKINSIYFGGGTPSLINTGYLQKILQKIAAHFDIDPNAEITLEANPDDLSPGKSVQLREISINRLSIGIQSFHDDDLHFLNRSHSGQQAISAIEYVKEAGFENISIDLIFGIPISNMKKWKENLKQAYDMDIQHISCYSLTVEHKTALDYFIKKGKSKPLDEMQSKQQFEWTREYLSQKGFLHYEISNYAREGFMAKHNTGYWKDMHYLGIGPSSHSFNGETRQWNISNNALYIKKMMNNEPVFESETINLNTKYNEYVMTSLRTFWGISLTELQTRFGKKYLTYFQKTMKRKNIRNHITIDRDFVKLNSKGQLIADVIISELFWV
jgi:putative oxygen-independent coproporphyrinogen III oxidase